MKSHPQNNNLLLFDLLDGEEAIVHFSTTRVGGVSSGPFASLNTGNFSDDSPLNIYENRQRIARMLFTPVENFIIPHQTHGNRVLTVDADFLSLSQTEVVETLYGVDAVVTNQPGVFLCVTTADCVPILLYDKEKGAIAAIHAGWKGTVGRIVENSLSEMGRQYGTSAGNLIVGMGPAISQQHYEVGDELVGAFREEGFDLSDRAVIYREARSGKWHIDLTEINRRELVRLGVPESQVEISGLCTFENRELFFSARRQTIHSGRMLTGIKLEVRG
jgi:YfiH family protein